MAETTAFLETRLAMYQLLQLAFRAPMESDLAAELDEAGRVYAALLDQPRPVMGAWDPERDLYEYNRLFVGPGRLVAPPYESVYLSPDAILMQDATLAVTASYRACGRAPSPDLTEPPDHLAIELEFYAWLQANADPGVQRQFYTEHLARWVPELCRRIREGTTSPFYRGLADITQLVISSEAQVLNACAGNGGARP